MRHKREFFLVLAAGATIAFGTLVFSPLLTKNLLFLAALPVLAFLFIILVLNINTTFLFVLWTRSLMDPLLAHTKVGTGAGIGGVLNLFVIVMVVLLALRFPKTLSRERHVLPWMVFLAIGAVTIFLAPMPTLSLRFWLSLVTYLCMFAAPFFIVKSERDKIFWIRTLLYSSVLPVMMACIGIATKLKFLWQYGRLSGTFTHANILAFYIVFVIAITFYVLKTGILALKLPGRISLCVYIGVLLTVLVVTQTRSAWIACGLFFLIYGLLKDRKLLLMCLLAGVIMTAVPQVQTRLKDLTEGTGVTRSEKLNSMAWRIKLWEYAVPSIKKRILVGHGLESFHILSKDFFPLEKVTGAAAHNVYVQLVFELGLFGLLAYLWIYTRLLKTFYRRMRAGTREISQESTILFAYIISYLIVSVSDNLLYYLAFNWYFWFFIGLLIHSGSIAQASVSVPSKDSGALPS